MAHSALQGHIELIPEAVKRKLHLKAMVTAKRNRIGTFCVLTGRKEDFTGICLFGVGVPSFFGVLRSQNTNWVNLLVPENTKGIGIWKRKTAEHKTQRLFKGWVVSPGGIEPPTML